jgi:transcriptional regulator with XRE-family HTH domain
MEGSGHPILSPPPLTTLRDRIRRLWRPGRLSSASAIAGPATDPLLAAGQELRRRRELHQLSLRDLAVETRISTAVLEALERGWRDRLPEATYLRTMLPLIERRLQMEPGSLDVVLPASARRAGQTQKRLRRFTPGAIDVFTTWQGTLLYGLLTLVLIQALNLEQQRLARDGLLTVAPLPAGDAPGNPDGEADGAPGGEELLLRQFPDLRPLDQASAGQGRRLWRRASSP